MFKKLISKIDAAAIKAKVLIESTAADGYVDSGVKIVIAMTIGAFIFFSLKMLFESNIMPTVTSKITGLFNYSGA